MNWIHSTAVLVFLANSTFAAAVAWPQFRGPNGSGIAEKDKPPLEFNETTNLVWKAPVPPGLSSPCVWEDRIFLTGVENDKVLALCYDRHTGKEVWRKEAPSGKSMPVHKVSSPAVATPASDGRLAYFYYPSFGLVAYDFKGEEEWRMPVPVDFVINGSGTSPVLAKDTLLLNGDQEEGKSFLLAVDARSGKKRWQTPRGDFISSYTTPILWDDQVILPGNLRVAGYDLKTGAERWTARVMASVSVAATPVVGGGHLFVMSRSIPHNAMGTFADLAAKHDKNSDGKVSAEELPSDYTQGGVFRSIDRDKDGFISESDWGGMTNMFGRGSSGLFAIREPGSGDVTDTHVVWKQERGAASIASPLFFRDRVYAVQDGGRLTCWDAKTGKTIYEQERLGADGQYYASPVLANGHIYLCSSKGTVTAVEAGDTLEVKARNLLREEVMATPAIADNKFYVRTAKHLWAFGSVRRLAQAK